MFLACLFRIFVWFQRTFETMFQSMTNDSHRKFFISVLEDYDPDLDAYVPEDAIFVEEWTRGHHIRRRILNTGERIVDYNGDPWVPVVVPWIWIGDTKSKVDLTEALSRYMVADNLITLDLLETFFPNSDFKVAYIDPRTFIEHDFPAEGVRIRALNAAR
uniref:Uncharacterized protein n=1 Tax=viral metagenome TaxID=1070528 RepID=A0A6C0M1E8_9ZZZZ